MGRLVIEPPMSAAQTAEWVTSEELAEAENFGSPRRREEFLTWRAIVRRELGRDVRIWYDDMGAPVVDRDVFISVAHCPGRIAVCFSERRCAVDIESEGRDFSTAASRCMTPSELSLSGDRLFPAALWCAKEALYKYAGVRELDLLRDLRIERAELASGILSGRIKKGEPIELSVCREDGYLAVYIL